VKLRFLGANRQVTGSRYCLEVDDTKVMLDCGMFQERPYLERNWETCPLPADQLDAVVLTHVHIDHCGLIPKLVSDGFRGPIYCTRPSQELADIILRDAARIQEEDVKYKLKRHAKEKRQGKHPVVPLFTESDVETALKHFQGVRYGQKTNISDRVSVTFHDAGHILGSAMAEFVVSTNNQSQRIIFSGDIGQRDRPLIRDPAVFEEADYVVMESTYGNRDHRQNGDIESQLGDVIRETVERGGNVVIPAFAMERSQELVYYISRLVHAKRIPPINVYLDSPMAVDVTSIFRNYRECFDQETWELIVANEPPLKFPGLHMVRSVEESKQINRSKSPCVIMATSGMCTAGRIKHHLRNNVGRPASTILFVGYQAAGTLGRQILEGQPLVRIHGRQWKVKAEVRQIDGFSGHADRSALIDWVGHLQRPPQRLFLTHGEESSSLDLAGEIESRFQWPVTVPHYGDCIELDTDSTGPSVR
jgi:metallo-beta-lactamase family protein